MPSKIRLGKDFSKWYAFYEESEYWTPRQIREFQFDRIRRLMTELSKTSNFYRERFQDINIKKITSFDEFCTLVPTLSKSEFRQNYKDILSSTYMNQKLVKTQTSGTTGMPLTFYHTSNDTAREFAAICHQWKRVGFSPITSRRAEFRSLTEKGVLVEKFPYLNKIRCSIVDLRKENVLHYADEIRKNNIDYYHGYPSALYLLSIEIIRNGIIFPQPKGILLASEIVYDWQIDRIMEAFPKAKIFAHYGNSERTVLAGWCEHKREYHVLPQYGYCEFDEQTSEIIGTNLYNTVNGFVRFQMTDTITEINYERCPDCQRAYVPRIKAIGGRSGDYLFSPEKGWIPPTGTYSAKKLKAIREMQLYQKEKSELWIRYTIHIDDNQMLNHDLNKIRSVMKFIFGESMKINFKNVDDFERGPTGKFKWIICELDEKPSLMI
jgi:phenylacetate-coenzyme A ligase PaaK-like adenylate-forming protein